MSQKLIENQKFIKILQRYEPAKTIDVNDLERIVNKLLRARSTSFGRKLRIYREKKKISQLALANYLNISRLSYVAWETGRHVPKLPKLEELSSYLEVDVSELISHLEPNETVASVISKFSKPLLEPSLMEKTKFPVFLQTFRNYEDTCCSVNLDAFNECDCVYIQDDDSMEGSQHTIPKGSKVLCSFKFIEEIYNKPSSEIRDFLSGKVVLLTILGQKPRLRQIQFDGQNLYLISWNDKSPNMTLPTGFLQDGDKSFHADNVEFFAIAEKVVYDL